jgi:hypothetical protein
VVAIVEFTQMYCDLWNSAAVRVAASEALR